ncbi:MAG: T9SS type A sorting domain-containing protein [Chitinophagaceae bacterium]
MAQSARPNGSGQDVRVKLVRFYPNPATTIINFEFQQDLTLSNYSFKVYNFIGKKVLELNNITSRTVVNLNDYFRGVYIFQLTDRNGQIVESGKFQVVK